MSRQHMIMARTLAAAVAILLVMGLGTATPALASETVTYFHNDIAGTPLVATDEAGNVVWKESYRPYGERLVKEDDSGDNRVWFTGKPHDETTGLSYFGARYYDPVLGRFMGIDPKEVEPGELHSFNRYAYANSNPYRYVDPDGLQGIDTLWMADDAPLVVSGRAYGALAALTHGLITGDEQLQAAALESMAGAEQLNREAVIVVLSLGRGRANVAKREIGSYTNTHASGRTYDGKGSRERSQASGRRVEQETGDQHVATEWRPAPTRRDAFKDESRRLDSHGGPSNSENYNKIESPGRKYRAKDGD